MFRFALVAAVAFLVPSTAVAGVRIEAEDARIPAARDLSAAGWRALPAQAAPYRFNMVGIHWRGSGRVFLRTAAAGGEWSEWRDARPEAEDAPDPGTAEARARRGWKLGNPIWVGPSDRIQLNVAGDIRRVRTFYVASPVAEAPAARTAARPGQPSIIPRSAWGADESIVRAPPWYFDRLAFAVVHHTAGGQPSSPAQSAAIVRGIQAYHVKGNGWNDIGYNFLVDRYGQVFEGRGGGIGKNVGGAHAGGFNSGSVGVAALGTFTSGLISRAGRRAIVRLLAWRLDLAHVNPTSRLTWTSAGNAQYPAGTRVRLRAVSGHRDTGYTSCPGGALYGRLPAIAESVRAEGAPKIYNPRALGSFGGPIRIRGRVDPATPWTVTVVDGSGSTVATGTGTTARVDWTWDSSGAAPEVHRWIIAAGDALEGTGLVGEGGAPPPAPGERLRLASSSASPRVMTPNGDRYKDTTKLAWRSSLAAELRVLVHDADGNRIGTAVPWTVIPAGSRSVVWNGAPSGGDPLPDGAYTLRFQARAGAQSDSRDVSLKLDRTLAALFAAPGRFSPNGDGRSDATQVSFSLARAADVVFKVKPSGSAGPMVWSGQLGAGPHALGWNGELDGSLVADGAYIAVVRATTALGTRRLKVPVVVDTRRPRLSNVTARRTKNGTSVKFRLNEAGPVRVRFGRQAYETTGVVGANRVWKRLHPERVRVRSWDAAGNRSVLARVAVR